MKFDSFCNVILSQSIFEYFHWLLIRIEKLIWHQLKYYWVILTILKYFSHGLFKKPNRCSVKIEIHPAPVLDKKFYNVPQENQDFSIKSEIKVENHDDLDDPIYKDSVSIY